MRILNFFSRILKGGETSKGQEMLAEEMLEEEMLNLFEIATVTASWVQTQIKDHDFGNGRHDKVLRNINPKIGEKNLFTFNDLNYETELNIELYETDQYQEILELVIQHRQEVGIKEDPQPLRHGKILCFIMGVSTHDGAPVAESHGFVDTYDIPPIDTWMMIKRNFLSPRQDILFCWIPNQAVPIMQDAIDVEILGSYDWLEDVKPELFEALKSKERLK